MSRAWLAGLAAAVVVLAGACGGDAGPSEFDPALMEADLAWLTSQQRNADNRIAGHGVDGVAKVMGVIGGGGIILSRASLSADAGNSERPPVSLSSREVPDTLRGRTLELNLESGGYLVSGRLGAPSNGVRIILYEVGESGATSVPLVEAGWLELRDQSSGARREMRLVAQVHDQVIYDYTGYATGAPFTGTYGVEGYITLNGARIDISGDGMVDSGDLENVASSAAISLQIPSRDFEAEYGRDDPGPPPSSEVEFINWYEGRGGRLLAAGRAELDGGDVTTHFRFEIGGETVATSTRENLNPAQYVGQNGHTVGDAERDLFDAAWLASGFPVQVVRELLDVLDPFIGPVPST